MYRNLLALAALLAMLATAFQALAVTLCTAGNPNTTSVIESTPTSAFTNHGDGTVTHNLTGLMWKRCAQGLSGANCATGTPTAVTWSAALAAAVADTTAGHSDWRLPNKKELESIVESCGSGPAINQILFPATPTHEFWSATSFAGDPTKAWVVNFDRGDTFGLFFKTPLNRYVRLVRGGQPFDSFDAQNPSTSCTYALSPLDLSNTAAAGGARSITITTSAECPVTATSYQPWVTVNSITPNGPTTTVALQISPNAGAARATAIVVAGRLYLITQLGP